MGEYGPEIKYIKAPDNDAADPLIALPLINYATEEIEIIQEHLAESYCVKKLDSGTLPSTYQMIDKYQRK